MGDLAADGVAEDHTDELVGHPVPAIGNPPDAYHGDESREHVPKSY